MTIILYIIGGLIAIAILWGFGFIQELLRMIGFSLGTFLIFGIIGASVSSWTFNGGAKVGIITGFCLYVLYCIYRIVFNPHETLTLENKKPILETNDRYEGAVGLVMVIVLALIYFLS